MNKQIPMFSRLEVETQSTCNRFCGTCLRNSIPDKEATSSWFSKNQLQTEVIHRVFHEAQAMGFTGEVCLSHYNEPLMDERIVDIARYAKNLGFKRVFMCTNADFLTEELAAGLDGVLNDVGVTIYLDEPKFSKRWAWVKSLFKATRVDGGPADHMVTHYSPLTDTIQLSRTMSGRTCNRPLQRMIVNHKGQMLLCCDDMIGNFKLGTVHDNSIEELWYSDEHQRLVSSLLRPGGRSVHQHCLSCPRP